MQADAALPDEELGEVDVSSVGDEDEVASLGDGEEEEIPNPEDEEEVVDENSPPVENEISPGHSKPLRSKVTSPSPLDLPIAVVRRLMKSGAPNKRFTPDFIGAVSRCAGAFGLYLLSASQEAGSDAGKSTLRPVDVLEGLLRCGFPELAEEARISLGYGDDIFRTKKGKGGGVHRR